MNKFGLTAVFIFFINLIAFTIDAFNASIDLLKWSDLPPFESVLLDLGLINIDKIENIVGYENYSNWDRNLLRYENGKFELDCSGNKSGLIISVDSSPDIYYEFNYFTDIYYFSRRSDFYILNEKICKDSVNLSLILTEKDSTLGIILF